MTDPREALLALLRQEGHAPMDAHDPRDGSCQSCPWPLHEMPPEDITDAILSKFEVTPRGEGASDFDLPPEAVEAAIIAHHNFVLGEDVPLTKREIGIAFQAWHAALTAALPHIAAAGLQEDAEKA